MLPEWQATACMTGLHCSDNHLGRRGSQTCSGCVQVAYNIDVVKTNVPEALEVLADAVLNPRFTTWEVAEQLVRLERDMKTLKDNPQTVLLEVTLPGSNTHTQACCVQCDQTGEASPCR